MKSGERSRSVSMIQRIGLIAAGVLIGIGTFLPLWGMTLIAPQYPEGLRVQIYANRLMGELDIINTLNHYVGMRDLDGMSFPELKFMTYALLTLAVLFLIAALIGRLWAIATTMGISIIASLIGIYDLYSKLYVYGHELDPYAPIKLNGGFTPPVLGENQLANFHTSSYFLSGSYLIILGGLIGGWILWQLVRKRHFIA
jgi:copper chaperone NosL